MKYTDYPDIYSEDVMKTLQKEYSTKKISPLSFLEQIRKENMNKPNIQQDEPIQAPNPEPINTSTPLDFRQISLISSNYCNLINLFNNIISKTSSSKKEYYQEINV